MCGRLFSTEVMQVQGDALSVVLQQRLSSTCMGAALTLARLDKFCVIYLGDLGGGGFLLWLETLSSGRRAQVYLWWLFVFSYGNIGRLETHLSGRTYLSECYYLKGMSVTLLGLEFF